ncbi:uncharacterized protein LOC130724475 [Lotus japonicus]|uniref:Uncharacterized protein n=1 Tax=Lotus japonicus TaxID=34305 RepID=I3SH30_LOTJA|nr:uncharacterized protein LOC130724475 [Lotus japonicus]AFK39572.1 unknown [Lotus japonicus]
MASAFFSKVKPLYRNPFPSSNSMAVCHRHRSSRATKATLTEIDAEHEVTLKMFDDLIQRILVKKATPDWLPFLPGYSFWVPPRPSPSSVVHLAHRFNSSDQPQDALNLESHHGWPDPKYFLQGNAPAHSGESGVELNLPEEGTVKVKVITFSDNVANSEDEEG